MRTLPSPGSKQLPRYDLFFSSVNGLVLQGIFVTFPERFLSNKYLLGPTLCVVGLCFFPPSLPPLSIEYFQVTFFFEIRQGRHEDVRFSTWHGGLALNSALPFLWAVEVSGGTEQGLGWAERCVTVTPGCTLSGKRFLYA